MRYFLVVLISLLFTFYSNSQVKINQGEWYERQDKSNHQGFVMSDSLHIYSIDLQGKSVKFNQKLFINVFKKVDLSFQSRIDISPEKTEGTNLDLVQIFSIEQTMILVMVESQEKKSGDKYIILQAINANGVRGARIVADTLPSEKNVNEDFQIVVDKSESGFVICTNYPVSTEENQKLKITAFSAQLNEKWKKTIVFPDKQKQYIFSDWRYDGNEKVFFLARHIIDLYQAEIEFTTAPQNTYFLWAYDRGEDKIKEIELSLNQRYIHRITIELDSNRWLIAGVFSNDRKFKTDGVFNLILDKNLHKMSHLIHDFNPEEQRLFSIYANPKNPKRGIDEIQMKSIQILPKGEFVLIGEEFHKEIQETNDGRATPTNFTEVFSYQNIALFWFEIDGKLKNVYCVPKSQQSVNDQGIYSSYSVAQHKGDLFFFFNDNPKNISKSINLENNVKPISGFRKTYLKSVQINSKGSIKTKIIQSPSRKIKVRPALSAQLLDSNAYFLLQKRKSSALLKLVFD